MLKAMIRRQEGFSLVEVLVAVGLMGSLGLAVSHLVKSTYSNQATLEANFEILSFAGEMSSILSSPEACLKSFAGQDATNSKIVKIIDTKDRVRFETGKNLGASHAKISDMRLSDSDAAVEVVANSDGDTYLEVLFDRGKASGGVQTKIEKLKIWVQTDSMKKITACRVISNGTDPIWKYSPTSSADIFFNSGRIGIGTDQPRQNLEILDTGHSTLRISADNANGFNSGIQLYDSKLLNGFTFIRDGVDKTGEMRLNWDQAENSATKTILRVTKEGSLQVAGDVSATSFLYTSDLRLKEKIRTVKVSSESISKFKPVSFRWKNNPDIHEIGLIAQDLERVDPRLVRRNKEGTLHISYSGLTAYLISIIQDQQKRIEKLEQNLER